MTTLAIQIPCLNEAESLPKTLSSLPKKVKGISKIIVIIVDDGSTDETSAIAKEHGVNTIIRFSCNRGLAAAFNAGNDAAIEQGADIIVNLDADGQYKSADIAALIAPVLSDEADIVIGCRNLEEMEQYSPLKRRLHGLGTKLINALAGTSIKDPVSGFRAISRDAAMQLNVLSSFSYTTEMLIQAHHKGLSVASIDIETNPTPRPSRLFKSIPEFMMRTGLTVLRTMAMYKPLKFFATLSLIPFVLGIVPIFRFLYFYLAGGAAGHIQSLIIGAAFLIISTVIFTIGILAELQGKNRKLLEKLLLEQQRSKNHQ